ncbi:hypothetical protein AAG570_005154 [Ranatra chinensis]|uniref:RCC1-like domain-containing protein n=1 Tax=Ranatra chinensis TaxID=642074 RepID=A0ABD0Y0J3_9HEMI
MWEKKLASVFHHPDPLVYGQTFVLPEESGADGCCLVVTKDDSVYFIDEEDESQNIGENNQKKKKKKKKRIIKSELLSGRRITGFVCGGGMPMEDYRNGDGDGSGDAVPKLDTENTIGQVPASRRMTVLDSWTKKRFYLALSEAGDIFTWGANNQGQLGRGGSGGGEDATPARILSLSQETIVQAAAGTAHAVVLTSNGKVYSWGLNECGECGTDRRVIAHFAPCEVWFGHATITGSPMTENSHSSYSPHFQHQQLRQPSGRIGINEQPSVVITAIACGASHSAAITSNGQVYSWGRNDRGQLGTGDREHRWRPSLVAELNDRVALGVACGSLHTAVILDRQERVAKKGSGVVNIWGDNTDGRLATITQEKNERKPILSLPTLVKRLHGIEAIFSSYDIAYTVAMKMDSTFVWGYISDKKILSTPKKKSRSLLKTSYKMGHTPCFTTR